MQTRVKLILRAVVITMMVLSPVLCNADWNNHDSHAHGGSGQSQDHGHHNADHHDQGHHDHSYIGVGFSVWPDSYDYGAPYYPPQDDVLVSPPAYQPVVINGITYYLNNGEYYVYNGYGYQVVPPPAVVNASAQAVDESGVFTINIPNNHGGYTTVILRKSGNGYIGPQGEFYPEFPKVAQLKVIYGK